MPHRAVDRNAKAAHKTPMRAMVIPEPGHRLVAADLPMPHPGPDQVRLRVHACGVCRTDLHILDGDLKAPRYPLVPGHQIVGIVESAGSHERYPCFPL